MDLFDALGGDAEDFADFAEGPACLAGGVDGVLEVGAFVGGGIERVLVGVVVVGYGLEELGVVHGLFIGWFQPVLERYQVIW